MTRRPFLLLLALAACLAAGAQAPRMCTSNNEVSFELDLFNRLWDYNRYEGSRWGMGLGVEFPWFGEMEKPVAEQCRVKVDGWFGYGVRDKAWKYGATASLLFPHGPVDKVYLDWKDDLERAGSRALKVYSPWEVWNNPGFFSDRYVRVQRFSIGTQGSIRGFDWSYTYRLGREQLLFLEDAEPQTLADSRFVLTYKKCLTLDFLWGNILPSKSSFYLRLLTQYSQRFKEHKWGRFGLFAQAGYATLSAPRQRWFDLGGTFDAPLYFRNTFHTVRPGEYYDNAFALAFLNYHTPAFYHTRLSNPRLFLQAGAQTGLEEPLVAELCLGLDRVIRWGILDLGVAGACQVYPESRFAILGVATLIFDE